LFGWAWLKRFKLFERLELRTKEIVMPLSYEDLIAPTIVRQVSKSVAYCRCTRSKNLPFCDGSHAVTSIKPHILEFSEPTTIAICRCWKSKDHPYCDGTHGRLVKPKERSPRASD
jgi:CDGSH-type Zn-finger protein